MRLDKKESDGNRIGERFKMSLTRDKTGQAGEKSGPKKTISKGTKNGSLERSKRSIVYLSPPRWPNTIYGNHPYASDYVGAVLVKKDKHVAMYNDKKRKLFIVYRQSMLREETKYTITSSLAWVFVDKNKSKKEADKAYKKSALK